MSSSTAYKFKQLPGTEFSTKLIAAFNAYLNNQKNQRFGNNAMYFKIGLIFALYIGSYALLLSNALSNLQLVLVYILFGISHALIAFNIGHDASHNALFKSKKLNDLFAWVFNLIGVNKYIWDIKHNRSHHTFTNVEHADMDIEQIKIVRLVPHKKRKPINRYQHIYAPMLYPFASLYMVLIKDFEMFLTKRFGNTSIDKHPAKEIAILFASKILYFIYVLAVPLLVLHNPAGYAILGFLCMHIVIGLYVSVILFPAHVIEGIDCITPEADGVIRGNWVQHHISNTVNFGVNNKLLTWLAGGLNTHVVHHIVPGTCHIHYFELSKILNNLATEYGVPVRNISLWQALSMHLTKLKQMGNND